MTSYSNTPRNGNGSNGAINGRGIKHRDLSHNELIGLAADAVSGKSPVVPSLAQATRIFEGVAQSEISEELKQRKVFRKETAAEEALFDFAAAWREQGLVWRVEALKWLATDRDFSAVWNTYVHTETK